MKKLLVTLGIGLGAVAAQGQWNYATATVSKQSGTLNEMCTNVLTRVTVANSAGSGLTNYFNPATANYAISSITVVTPAAGTSQVPDTGIVNLTFYDTLSSNATYTVNVTTNYQKAWTSNYWGLTNIVTYMTNTTGWFTNATTGQGYGTIAPSAGAGLITNIDTGYCMFPVTIAAGWIAPPPILAVSQPLGTSQTYLLPCALSKSLAICPGSLVTNVSVLVKYMSY